MGQRSDAPCAQCRRLSPYHGENKSGTITVPYNCSDHYPDFPALEAQARKGCAFCGLLRHTLQAKYSDEKLAEAESDFHPSIRAKWPTGWDGHVIVDRARFDTEQNWPYRDDSQILDQSLGDIRSLSLDVWPYPPRRNPHSPESNRDRIWFAVYADDSGWENDMIQYILFTDDS